MATKQEIVAFMASDFPQFRSTIESVGKARATVNRIIEQADLRPGDTVSGTTLVGIADEALYVALFGEIGIVPLAVTTNLSINFLRKPPSSTLIKGVCQLFKVGKTLAVGEVSLYAKGMVEPVAHVVGTYAIPSKK